MKYLLSLILLLGCQTTNKWQYEPKFAVSECARVIVEKLPPGVWSEGIPFEIIDKGENFYLTSMHHPKVDTPTIHIFSIKNFDENFEHCECP